MSESGPVALDRLLRPRTIAVLGGSWARSVVEQCLKMQFTGEIWPVHPTHQSILGLRCYPSLHTLPSAPDATFIGINRHKTIDAVATLASMDAGGAVCFASGFSEASAEDNESAALQTRLLQAAGTMPIIGPNCYGLINYLDGALLWPDQHGGQRTDTGVAVITQSSNIAINLTMQQRGLPIAYVVTAGNQAQLSLGQLGMAVLEDSRVTALGLHIEGFGDIAAFERMAAQARLLEKPIVALKSGRSSAARQAMISHTNSLSGSDAAADAFLDRLGIARVDSLTVLLETLKILHVVGPLDDVTLHSMSCSGGEAGLMADANVNRAVTYPVLEDKQRAGLRAALGPLVALNNPLDYHTYIWDELDAMTAAYSAMLSGKASLSLLVNDFPRSDRCEYPSWLKTIDALIAARDASGGAAAMLATLPENMPEHIAQKLMSAGIVPLEGIDDAMAAIEAAARVGASLANVQPEPTLQCSDVSESTITLSEAVAKQRLKDAGLTVPNSIVVADSVELAEAVNGTQQLQYPVVLKGLGSAHKTEHQLVDVNLQSAADVLNAAKNMQDRATGFLLEEFVDGVVAEMLVSITRDSTHGLLLTLASGGVMTELIHDSVNLLLPYDSGMVRDALRSLKLQVLLEGYRGSPPADVNAIIDAIMALQKFAIENVESLQELEINPLLCRSSSAVVVDALICLSTEKKY